MANGVEQNIGIGQAQVLPKGASLNQFVQQLNEQKQQNTRYKDYQQRLADEKKERDEKDLYGIIGNALNPKNFNSLIHDKVRIATAEMAAKIKGSKMDYGSVYMDAINKAGELGGVSDKLNKIDAVLSATRNEYEKYDKRLNTPAIEFEARKKIFNQLKSGQPIDENYNYFDDALGGMGSDALTDKSDAIFIDLLPEEISDFEGDYTERKLNRSKTFDWQLKAHPGFYDVQQKSNLETPTVITKGVPSGQEDDSGKDIPMLNEEGYGKFILLPSNRKALDTRIEKYGNIPKNSQQADILRRIEAYNYLESKKPPLRTKEKNIVSYPPSTTNIFYGSGKPGASFDDYQVLPNYNDRVVTQKMEFPLKVDGKDSDFKETKEVTIIPANQVAKEDKELIKVTPYTNKGMQYYIVRDDGNWEGMGGQIIYKDKVAQKNMDITAENEAKRGRTLLKPTIGNPNDKRETIAERMRRLGNQK